MNYIWVNTATLMKTFGLQSFIFLASSVLFFSFTPPKKKKIVKKSSATAYKISSSTSESKINPYYIIVDKSDYELRVYDAEGWYATYPVVFGSKDQNDKLMEGDKKTPEGKFKILIKKINPKWGPQFTLDYPTVETIKKFNERRAKGLIPMNASVGSGIAIHSTRPQEEWTVDYFQNWTDGCISLKYSEAKDLYSYIPNGTPVTIQK